MNQRERLIACPATCETMTPDWIRSTLAMIPAGETVVGLTDLWLHENGIVDVSRREFIQFAHHMSKGIAKAMETKVVFETASRQIFSSLRTTRLGKARLLFASGVSA